MTKKQTVSSPSEAVTDIHQQQRKNQSDRERRALRFSLGTSVAIAVAAIILGVAVGSRVVIFDGVYMAFGLLLTAASLLAARAVAAGPTRRFPFGREALAPLVVVAQGLAIALALVLAAADALVAIRDGGSHTNAWAIGVYGAATSVVGFVVAMILVREAGHSDIVRAEAAQWRSGSILSIMMIIGALFVPLIRLSAWPGLANYIDPILVLLAVLVLAAVPIRLLRSGLKELLESAPPPKLADAIDEAVEQVREQHNLPEPIVRSGKVGQKLYVEVEFVITDPGWSVAHEDAVRRGIVTRLRPLGFDVWASVSVTLDPELTE